ncbi:MAG: ShlB/FhaC/HecB family hemolysin secretion/activation protein [Pseudomonadota bacterium]|uniref:ShlB/FhaC/HecB family hemolysin secretion/activation protein n=1 Tax=Sphingomonas sp. ERG5 TaxID=1381597 RepID=UPI00068AB794|nr:ShlB/FhaC/HecB family hemolysin secretion/activation protein [Sphingomonas sp. ERG5]
MHIGFGHHICASALLLATASVAAAQEAPVTGAAAAETPADRRIDILNYRIEGNTVLARMDVEKAVLPFLGPKRSTADVENARVALVKAYRAKGFETVDVEIPEQDVRGGIVRLNVVELRVGRLRVTDARFTSPGAVKARAPSIAEGTVPNYTAIYRDVAALNKSSDRTITPALRAGDTPGTVDIDLQVEDKLPLHATLELNDRTSARTKRLRTSASVSYSNLFQMDHSASIQGQFSPENPKQSWVVSGSYAAPIAGTGFTIVGYGVHSDSDVAAIGGIGVLGSGDIVGVRGIYNFSGGEGRFHTITAGVDYKSFNESLILGSDTAATPIDYIPLTLQYAFARRGPRSDLDLSLALNFGVRGLTASDEEFRLKRFSASASWAYLRADLSYLYRMRGDLRIGVRFGGQFSRQPLISNEQFSAGGLESVRGYYESQALGDSGYFSQLDVESPSLHKPLGKTIDELRLFAFIDSARTWIRNPLADINGAVDDGASLSSVGLGLRLKAFRKLNLSTLLAMPLVDRGSALTDINDRLRAQFRVWLEF